MTRVAAIDCGTNSIRLLVADVDDGRRVHDIDRRMRIVRLGEGVDRTGRLSDAALERTWAACDEYAGVIASAGGVEAMRFVATSASRDAENRDVFVAGVRDRLGVEPEVVSGGTEAALSFAGATSGLTASGPFLVVDIGGGSTEFVRGSQEPEHAVSVDMGCVRITERVLHGDPPSQPQVDEAVRIIDALLDDAAEAVPLRDFGTLLGLAGSVTTVSALALELPEYDSARIHGSRIAAADVHRITTELLAMPRARRAELGVMHPGRVDVIGAGALVLDRIVRRTGAHEVLVSEHDILDGIALSVVP